MRPRLDLPITLATLCGLLLGCERAEPDKLVSEIVPGLSVRGSVALTPDDHLVELVVHEGYVYVANSWFGVGVMRLEDDGSLTITDRGSELYGELRCTSLAVHPSSDTLYCAGDTPSDIEPRIPGIERFDLSNPAEPIWLEPLEIQHWAVRDIEVFGDTLLIHQLSDGLWTADIAADGALSNLEQVEVEGNARTSVVVDGHVVTMFSDPAGEGTQLRLYDLGGSQWTELARLSLAGPPLGISADADGAPRVAVGLGSGGMTLVEVGPDSLTPTRSFEPPAVVTMGLVADGLAVAVTLSGAFAWTFDEAGEGEPRLFGFGAEGTQGERRNGSMLHGLLHEGELLTSDWTWVERWAIEPEGEVVALDVPRGLYVKPGGPVRWAMRNPGPVPLRAELWSLREHLLDVEIDGHEIVEVELSAARRAALVAEGPATIGVRVHDPSVVSEGQPLSTSALVIVEREAGETLPPATGDLFPSVSFADRELELFELPWAEDTQAIWFTTDCALMWPEVEDLAWHARSGVDLGRGRTVILTDTDLVLDGFDQRWSVESLDLGLWGLAGPPELATANEGYPEELYQAFYVPELSADAVVMDTVIDADGRISSIERMYRGPWSLALPWPWD